MSCKVLWHYSSNDVILSRLPVLYLPTLIRFQFPLRNQSYRHTQRYTHTHTDQLLYAFSAYALRHRNVWNSSHSSILCHFSLLRSAPGVQPFITSSRHNSAYHSAGVGWDGEGEGCRGSVLGVVCCHGDQNSRPTCVDRRCTRQYRTRRISSTGTIPAVIKMLYSCYS